MGQIYGKNRNAYNRNTLTFTFQAIFNYTNVDSLQSEILELPYQNVGFNMVIILPWNCTDLATVEKLLPMYDLTQLSKFWDNTDEIVAKIPKFSIDFSMALNRPLDKVSQWNCNEKLQRK